MVKAMPCDFDNTWCDEIKILWNERRCLRTIFDDDFDAFFDNKYNKCKHATVHVLLQNTYTYAKDKHNTYNELISFVGKDMDIWKRDYTTNWDW
jgi:hypothetical protein